MHGSGSIATGHRGDGAATGTHPAYRPDIDGLRSLAVTSVVAFHAMTALAPSGFVGVDIFFVISGYLIGGIIHRETEAGTFSFARFYARRARRILPALLVTLCFTLVVGLAMLATGEAMMLAGSTIWTLLGFSNIFFWRHIDYFSPSADQNPLLMTWSLGVEEQFYLLFPLLMLLLSARAPRFRVAILAGCCALSFGISLYQAGAQPLAGFYLLPSRVWELGLGALLAIVHAGAGAHAVRRTLPGRGSNVMAALALAALIASFYAFDSETPFPGAAALLPVLATLALLHSRDSMINRRILGNRLPVAIGLLSYSWYLWHWPMLAFVRIAANGTQADVVMVATALASLGVAYLSWRYVETPFRSARLPAGPTLLRYGALLLAFLAAAQGLKAVQMLPGRLPAQVARIEREIRGGEDCMSPFGGDALPGGATCRPAGASVALLGDSHAAAYAPGLAAHVRRQGGGGLMQLTKPSCSPLLGYSRRSDLAPGAQRECLSFTRKALAAILADPRIDTVVLAGFWPAPDDPKIMTESGGRIVPASGREAIARGLPALTAALVAGGKRVVVVQDVPLFNQDAARHLLSDAIPLRRLIGAAAGSPNGQWTPAPIDYGTTRALVAGAARARPGIGLIDPFAQLCAGGVCRIAANGLPLFRDKQHLSLVGSAAIDWSAL